MPQVTRFGWTYAPGDKVLQTVNNYEKDVYNSPFAVQNVQKLNFGGA